MVIAGWCVFGFAVLGWFGAGASTGLRTSDWVTYGGLAAVGLALVLLGNHRRSRPR